MKILILLPIPIANNISRKEGNLSLTDTDTCLKILVPIQHKKWIQQFGVPHLQDQVEDQATQQGEIQALVFRIHCYQQQDRQLKRTLKRRIRTFLPNSPKQETHYMSLIMARGERKRKRTK